MRKILFITFSFLLFSCNTNEKNSIKWTEAEKDKIFKDCIKYSMEIKNTNAEKANEFCYCSLDILVEKFDNKKKLEEEIAKDPSIRSIWLDNCQ